MKYCAIRFFLSCIKYQRYTAGLHSTKSFLNMYLELVKSNARLDADVKMMTTDQQIDYQFIYSTTHNKYKTCQKISRAMEIGQAISIESYFTQSILKT